MYSFFFGLDIGIILIKGDAWDKRERPELQNDGVNAYKATRKGQHFKSISLHDLSKKDKINNND